MSESEKVAQREMSGMVEKAPLHLILSTRTNRIVSSPYRSLKRARRRRDALDLAYGCICHTIREA